MVLLTLSKKLKFISNQKFRTCLPPGKIPKKIRPLSVKPVQSVFLFKKIRANPPHQRPAPQGPRSQLPPNPFLKHFYPPDTKNPYLCIEIKSSGNE
jgi:hypothetical protein